jgi:rhodanese-related sulfurtransferase
MGYKRVAVLDGGINAWASHDMGTQWGMNVLGKDFGEHVEVKYQVPTIHPDEIVRRRSLGEKVVVLDTRTYEEYQKHCVPDARSMPGVELALRIEDVRSRDMDSLIVVSCAGRTRSIIGTRLAQRMGVERVVGLRNGISGWFLAGHALEEGANRLDLAPPSQAGLRKAEEFARRVATEDGVGLMSADELAAQWEGRNSECTYLVDVRTAPEHLSGHIPGSTHFPGGQAVQRAEDVAPVRGAKIIFYCDGVVRSFITASWFRQMGFERVCALDGGIAAWSATGRSLTIGPGHDQRDVAKQPMARTISASQLHKWVNRGDDVSLLFVGTSREFATGHVQGSRWISRSWLELNVADFVSQRDRCIVISDIEPSSARLAADALSQIGFTNVYALEGGTKEWAAADLPIEIGLGGVMQTPNDVLPPPTGPERSHADMINYLRWEEALGRKYAQAEPSS